MLRPLNHPQNISAVKAKSEPWQRAFRLHLETKILPALSHDLAVCETVWLLCPGSTVSTEYSTGMLYSVGSGSPSEDWGKMVLPLQNKTKTSFPFLCTAVTNFLAVLLYTLTQPLTAKIYIPDSAIYSLLSQQQVYMPYMTTCDAFDHYSIYQYIIDLITRSSKNFPSKDGILACYYPL